MPRNNKIIIRSGTVTPTASDFAVGEPAFDKSAGKLYIKNEAGAMVDITGSGGGGGSVDVYAYASPANFPATGSSAVIYLAMNTSRMYQWAGTVYVEMGPLSVGDTVIATSGSSSSAGLIFSSSSSAIFSSSSSAAAAATPMAVLLTSGTSYTVPAGATLMKAWAVGAGGSAGAAVGNAGAVAYKTWTVTGGSSVAYSLGANSTYYSRSNTTVTYDGTTISAQSGSGSDWNGNEASAFSGGDGGAAGGIHTWDGVRRGGAVGGNGTVASCGRIGATDVSGLFAAVQLAGGNTTETCATTAAFGSGGYQDTGFKAGIGGGGAYDSNTGDQTTTPGGPSAVVLYFNAGGSANTGAASSASSSSAAGGGGGGGSALSITSQPLNDYIASSSQSTTFSVTASGGGTPTYQWQYYGMDEANSLYDDEWRNMSGVTASSVTLNGTNAFSYAGYPYYYNGQLKLRCIVTPSDGGSAVTSDIVRMIQLDMLHQPYPTWYNGSNGNYANYGSPQTISVASGESVKLDVSDYAMAGADTSWFSGDDTTFKIQVATTGHTDSADWTDLYSSDFRGYFSYLSGYEILPSTGTKYYRVIMIAKWPYTATNGTGSATHATQPLYPHSPSDALRVDWPAPGVTVLSGSASGSGTNTITATAAGNIEMSVPSTRTLTWTGNPGQYITGPQQAGFDYDSEIPGWYRNFLGSSFTVIAGTYRTEYTGNGATLTFTP